LLFLSREWNKIKKDSEASNIEGPQTIPLYNKVIIIEETVVDAIPETRILEEDF